MLKITNLTKDYGSKKAIDSINLEVKKGEIFGFIGHNGAGKTTTIKSIVGIQSFDSGSILIDGVDILKDDLKCKKMIAYIPDNPDIYENMKGIDYLNFIADMYEVDENLRENLIDKYAKKFEIYENLNEPVS